MRPSRQVWKGLGSLSVASETWKAVTVSTYPDPLQPTGYGTPPGATDMRGDDDAVPQSSGGYSPVLVGKRNVPGRIALALGVVLAIGSLIQQAVLRFYPLLVNEMNLDVDVYVIVSGIATIGSGLIAIVAVIFGVIGLVGANRPRGSAAAGLAIGVWVLLQIVVGLFVSVIIEFL